MTQLKEICARIVAKTTLDLCGSCLLYCTLFLLFISIPPSRPLFARQLVYLLRGCRKIAKSVRCESMRYLLHCSSDDNIASRTSSSSVTKPSGLARGAVVTATQRDTIVFGLRSPSPAADDDGLLCCCSGLTRTTGFLWPRRFAAFCFWVVWSRLNQSLKVDSIAMVSSACCWALM